MKITLSYILKDKIVLICFIFITILSIFFSVLFGKIYGLFVFLSFGLGNLISILIITQRDQITQLKNKYFHSRKKIHKTVSQCDVCQEKHCTRHQEALDNSNVLLVNCNLDNSIESFYSKIIGSFVQSWFSLLSHDENFVHTLKKNLREATTHLVLKIRKLNGADFITQKICPLVFKHIDNVQMMMINEGIANDKLPNEFLKRNYPIHPACANRKAEKDYLRAVAKCLIPKIFHSENFDSKIFFSLIRELLACWVFLPLMDVTSDPNLLNLMVVQMLNKSQNDKFSKFKEFNQKVEFLKKFIHNSNLEKNIECDSTILTNHDKLYAYMQFLKKNGMVDILRFYLDVESLNKESNIAIDPTKISALQEESERLLLDYNKLIQKEKFNYITPETTLTKAQDNIRNLLEGKLRKEFTQTPDYFKLIYGGKEIEFLEDNKNLDQNTVAKIRSKIKGALKTLDGEIATEIPTVWDAFALEPHANLSTGNTTIYNSVTQKLRRERGQNLDAFLLTFIQSLEQNTDVGIEVVDNEKDKRRKQKSYAIESSLIFGDLFGLSKFSKKFHRSFYITFDVIGASRSLLYIVHKLLTVKNFVVKLIFSLICLWQETVDNLICHIINKLISMGLYQPRLAILIALLEEHLFEEKHSDTTYAELMERKNNAKELLISYNSGFSDILEILQCPVLNKHLMYCIFDAVLSELYSEFKN